MKKTAMFAALVFVCSSGWALAGDKGKANVPESVTLDASTVKTLQEKAKDAKLARLEAEKLARDLELGKTTLEKLMEEAKKTQEASDTAFIAECEKVGIPRSEVNNYEGAENEKGEFVLKRKPPQKK